MTDSAIAFQVVKPIAKDLVANKRRGEGNVSHRAEIFPPALVVLRGGAKGKHCAECATKRMTRDIQRIVLVFLFIKEVRLEHTDDFFPLALDTAVGAFTVFIEEVPVETFVDSAVVCSVRHVDIVGGKAR
eukprot:CAMPEP_0196155672 /NCGR_PEP_ID=MMETSP0910-20130528/41055_1 /TAXON_ID=49265 /ORGANISM="Thalassiosira rotula, Strain GSO102" /LENGTH=129 /DNA_ID=CAMNT_0041419939 /DNA_START=112 /DNA_END=501 /DNA_ORIENTATION=+